MAGGVRELLCLGQLLCVGRLVTGLASGAPLAAGTHSSLLEFDTWRLTLSSQQSLGCHRLVPGKSAKAGGRLFHHHWLHSQQLLRCENNTSCMATLWHPSNEIFNIPKPKVAKKNHLF